MSLREYIRRLTERVTESGGIGEGSRRWMAFIHAEVQSVCKERGWAYQVRRKWTARGTPVWMSLVDDHEWKLVPGGDAKPSTQEATEFDEGRYYVLSFDPRAGKFLFEHDTHHCGAAGPHWARATYTEIHIRAAGSEQDERVMRVPPQGWLRNHLTELTSQFGPNEFSVT